MMPNDLPPWHAVQQQTQRWLRANCFEHLAHDLRAVLRQAAGKKRKGAKVDTLGHLLALKVTAGNEQDRAKVGDLANALRAATGENVELAYVDQGYTGEKRSAAATEHGLQLEVIKHQETRHGFVLLPRRWVVERSLAWAARFRRLARDYEYGSSSAVRWIESTWLEHNETNHIRS